MKKNSKLSEPLVTEVAGVPLYKRQRCAYPEQVTKWFAIVMLALFPLVISPDLYIDITDTKYYVFRIFVILFLSLILLVAFGFFVLDKEKGTMRLSDGVQRLTIPQWLLIAYLLAAVVSAAISKYHGVWIGQGRFEGLLTILMYGAVFLLLSFWGEYSNLYVYGFGLSMTVFSVISILQTVGVDSISPEGGYYTYHFLGTIGQQDVVSGLVALAMPVLGCAFILLEGKLRYWFCLPPFLLLWYLQLFMDIDSGKIGLAAAFVFALLLTFTTTKRMSRFLALTACLGAVAALHKLVTITGNTKKITVALTPGKTVWLMLAAAVFLGAAAYLLSRRQKPLKLSPKAIRIIIAVILVLILICACVYLYRYDGNSQLLIDISQVLHGNLTDTAGTCRGYIWKSAVKLIQEMPWLGSGPDTFLSRFDPYLPGYVAVMKEDVQVDFAHNDFLQIGVNQGLIGLGLYLAFLVALFIRAMKVADRNPLVIVFAAGIIGYLGHVFFGFSITLLAPMYWVAAGLMDKCVRQTVYPVAPAVCEQAEPQPPKEAAIPQKPKKKSK